MAVNVSLRKVTGIVCLINSKSGCFGHGCYYLAHVLLVLRHILSKIPTPLMVILEYSRTNWVWITRAPTCRVASTSLSPLIKRGPLRLWYSQQHHCVHHYKLLSLVFFAITLFVWGPSLTYTTCEPAGPSLWVRAEHICTQDKLQSMRWFVKKGGCLLKAFYTLTPC